MKAKRYPLIGGAVLGCCSVSMQCVRRLWASIDSNRLARSTRRLADSQHNLTAIAAVFCGVWIVGPAVLANADSCVLSDSFGDNTLSPLWTVHQSSNSTVDATESSGRLRFVASENVYPNNSSTIVASDYWGMDMTGDWAISGDWWATPPQPTWGETSLSLGILLIGDPYEASVTYGATATIGYAYDPNYPPAYRYEMGIYWANGDWEEIVHEASTRTSGTSFIWYDVESDTISIGDSITDPYAWSIPYFRSNCPGTPAIATVFIMVQNLEDVPAYNSGTYAIDNFCVVYGATVNTGACCANEICNAGVTSEECTALNGTYQGDSTTCYDVSCEQAEYCTGDVNGDGSVALSDILILTSASVWDSTDYYSDIDGNGIVGIGDLLMLLEYWGSCP
jgi:hypothetical protein